MRSNQRSLRPNEPHIQLEFDFSIIPVGSNVIVNGFDVMDYIDLTGSIGIVENMNSRSGDYAIFFPNIKSPWDGLMILYYRRNQLTVIPGKKSKTSWQRKRLIKKVFGKQDE